MSNENLFNKVIEELKKFKKPSIPFKMDRLIDDNILCSKIHGTPYWEKGVPFPEDGDGQPMLMMAQINLAKVPELPYFPKKGIIQFFISNTDCYGINFEEPIDHKSNKVIYWPNPSMESYSEYPEVDADVSPASQPLSIEPQKVEMEICGPTDEYNFEKIFNAEIKLKFLKLDEEKLYDFLYESDEIKNAGSKMGGFAYFTQSDPRAYGNSKLYDALGCKMEDNKEFIILLQLDSDHESMLWGDCGVANWHILKEDLEKLDFSKVFYTWDCC